MDACPEFLSRFGIGYARRHRVLGLEEGSSLSVAFCDRDGWAQLDLISRVLRRQVEPRLTTAEALLAAINTAYADRSSQAQQVLDSLDGKIDLHELEALAGQEDLLDTEGRARSSGS